MTTIAIGHYGRTTIQAAPGCRDAQRPCGLERPDEPGGL